MFFTFALPKLPGPDVMQGCGMHAFTFPMLTFLVSVDSGFQGIDEAGYHSCVRCCRYIRETQVNPQCRQAGMNIQCVPHRLTNTRSQLINSIDILRARRATGLMTRDNYRTVNNITLGKYPEAK